MKTRIVYDRHRARDLTGLTWIRLPAEPPVLVPKHPRPVEPMRAPPAFPQPFDHAYPMQVQT